MKGQSPLWALNQILGSVLFHIDTRIRQRKLIKMSTQVTRPTCAEIDDDDEDDGLVEVGK